MKNSLVFLLLLVGGGLFGQKGDYNWLSGYDSYAGYSTNWGFYFGTSVLDFNHPQVQISYDSLKMNFDKTNISYSDSNGNLLFYSNGIYIANALDQKINNSDSMNAGWLIYTRYTSIQTYGYRYSQSMITIPNPNSTNGYYLFHTWIDSFGTGNVLCKKTLCTFLDMDANGGLGQVLYKNVPILTGALSPEITATRHGNGRDWWILVQQRNTNCYTPLLISDTGIAVMPVTCGGLTYSYDDAGAVCFSPDGSKFVSFSGYHGVDLFDFDRCTGTLSNPITIPINHSGWLGMGVAISPNNRFLYVSYTNYIFQLDLLDTNSATNIDTVAVFDGTNAPYPAVFNTAQNAPDGKIYISCGNGDTTYHVINNPNLKGDSCTLVQRMVVLPSPSLGLPNFPNYRLGAWIGSACDSLTTFTEEIRAEKEKILKVFPNPATDVITVDYGFTDWNKGEISLEITNPIGQIVYQQQLPMYSAFQKIDVSKFASGMYTATIKRQNQTVAVSKFVKE